MSATGRPFGGAQDRRWRLRGRFPDGALEGAPYPTLVRHLLWHRGLRSAEGARRFMEGPPAEYDPLLLPDIEPALARLREAARGGERVAIYGDFDVDGVTSCAILVEGLRALGADAFAYIPDRFTEGYGVNCGALDRLRAEGASLVVTADCGTSSIAEVAHARGLGMDVVILDHHSVPPQLPAAVATVNPKRPDSRYPEAELATVGLAYKLMGALYESMGRGGDGERWLDLVALGTVADVAPLMNENRWLLKRGLERLARSERPGLRALMEASGIEAANVDAEAIAYGLAPRLNAAGRLKHARLALDLLLEGDEEEARRRALELTALNRERQEQTAAAMSLAAGLLETDPDASGPLIFLGHEEIPSGIVGLVAGRLAEERYRPAVVYERGAETSRASCRSIPEFDITSALRGCAELLERFGGHRAAAGFTARNEMLPALKEGLLRQAETALAGIELVPAIDIDAALPLGALRGREIRALSLMAPFGQGNPEPTFLSRGVEVIECRTMGEDGRHLRLKLGDRHGDGGRVTWPAVAFGLGEADVREGQRLDVVYSLSADRWSEALELRVKDVAPAGQEQDQGGGQKGDAR